MKNSPADSVSKSQRLRANTVWLMNAATLAVAIGAVSQVTKSKVGSFIPTLVPTAQAADYYWIGGTSASAADVKANAAWWSGTSPKAASVALDAGTAAGNLASDFMYFGSNPGATTTGYTFATTISLGSSNRTYGGFNFVSGAAAYTFSANNTRKFEFGAGAATAASTIPVITNNSTSAITFNAIFGTNTGSTTAAVVNQSNATGSLVFNGVRASSDFLNPYAYDWAISVGSNAAAAYAFASTIAASQALAISVRSASSTSAIQFAGSGTITVNGTIDNGYRNSPGSGTSPYASSRAAGNVIITNTGTTNLNGWNTYTGNTTIGDGSTTGGTVVVGNAYAFGGNRNNDTTAGRSSTADYTAAAGYTGLAYYVGGTTPGAANSALGNTYGTGFANATVGFGTVTVNSGYTIDLKGTTMVGANALTLNGIGASAGAGALKNSSSTTATWAGAVTLGSNSNITAGTGSIILKGGLNTSTYTASIDGAQGTTLSGAVTGSGAINKSGAGTLTISGANNTYTGSLNIDQGVVTFASTNASAFSASTSALSFGSSDTPTLTLAGKSLTRGNISSTNTNAVIENNNASAATLTSSAPSNSTFAGVMQNGAVGTLSFAKAGAGTLTLSGANTYTGSTTISGGTLNVAGSLSSSSEVTVNSGGALTGKVGVGNLTLGTTNLNGGGTLSLQVADFGGLAGTTGYDLLTTGALTISASSGNRFTIAVNTISSSTADTAGNAVFNKANDYSLKIISASSISGFATDNWNISTVGITNATSGTWSVSTTGNDIYLNYAALTEQFWNGASGFDTTLNAGGSGSWTSSSTGYDSSFATTFGGAGDIVTVGSPTTTKMIKFTAGGYTLTGGSVTLNGSNEANNTIDVGTGLTATINSKLVSSSVVVNKTGLGTLVLGGDNSSSGISGGLKVTNGILKIASAGALGSSSSAVTVSSGSTLDLNGQSVSNTNPLSIAGTGAASAGGALINSSSTNATYAGLLTLTAATTINASSGGITLSNAGTITGSGFGLTVDGSYDTSISSIIGTGAGAITKNGTGILTLSGANTYTGGVSITAGRVKLGSASALGTNASAVTVSSGATLDLNGQSVTNTNALTLRGTGASGAGGALINSSSTNASYAGLVTLGAATTINAQSGNISLTNAGTITGSGFGLTVDGSYDTSISSIIGTGAGAITKNGTGILTLSGANTYTGGVSITAGRVKLGSASALGTNASAVTVSSGATLDLNSQTVTNTNALSLSGTGASGAGGALINSGTSGATYTGVISMSTNATISASGGDITIASASNFNGRTYQLTVDGAYNTTINSGVNSSTNSSGTGGYLTFVKKGTGTLTLNGYNNSSTGPGGVALNVLTIDAGTVKLGHTQALGANGANAFGLTWAGYGASMVINNGGTLDVNGLQYGKTPIIVLQGSGAAGMGGAIVNSSTSAAGKMQGVYLMTGDTTIASNGAGLDISANSSNVKFFNAKDYKLTLSGSDTSTLNILSTALVGTGELHKGGTGTWTLTPNNSGSAAQYYIDATVSNGVPTSYSLVAQPTVANSNFFTGAVYVDSGILRLGNNNALGSTGTAAASVTVANGASLDMLGTTISVSPTLNLAGTGAAGAGGALYTSTRAATYSGAVSLQDNATIGATGGNFTLTSTATVSGSGKTLTIDGAYNTTINSVIDTGSGGVIKNGAGTLTLAGANTFTGNIAVNAGRLQLNNAGAIGSSSSPTVSVASGATLDLNGITATNNNNLTIAGTGAAGYGGALINSLSGVAAAYSGNITLADNATINASAGIISLSGVISGNYNLEVAGGSTTRWTRFTGASANTFSSLTLSGYDLGFTNANQLGSGTITAASANARIIYGASSAAAGTGASFSISNALNTGSSSSYSLAVAPNDATNTITLDGKISGSGKLKASAGGTLVLANTGNDFTGGIEIGTGNISVASSAPLGSGNINFGTTSNSGLMITDNATIGNTFTISGSAYTANIDVASGKTAELTNVISPTTTGGKLVKTGNGILALSGVNTYGGTTTITGGTLNLKNSGSIAGSGVTVGTGATLMATNNAMPASASTGSITLNSGALVDLQAGSLKANNLTVAALSGADITKISYTIGNSLALNGNLTLTGNLAIDLTSTINGAGVYDVLTWENGSLLGAGTISFIDHSNADWTMTATTGAKKYTITVASSFTDGGNYSSGSIVIPEGKGLGEVSGTSVVTAANATTITTIAGGTVTLNGSGNSIGTLSAGTLNVKAASTITTLTAGTLSVDSGVDAEVKAGTSDAKITGAGNLLKSGNGKLTLSNATSDFTGATKVAAGELEVTSVAALGSTSGVTLGTASSSTAATFNYSGSADTITSNITALSTSTSGNVVQNSGTGLLTLGGTLTKDGTVLTLAGGNNGIKVTGNIAGTSANSDLVVSSGVVTVSSSNSYNGPTFVQAGATLVADNASATGTGIVNVANGATLQVGTATHMLTLTTGGFALTNGAHIKVYVDHVDITGVNINSGANIDTRYAHYDLTDSAGTTYSSLFTSGALNLTGVTVGGITIDVYSTDSNSLMQTNPFYDFKFLEAATITGLGSGLNIADLFTINTSNLKYANGNTVTGVSGWGDYSDLIKVYTVTNGSNTVLMMSIPEPSTYGLGLGALALAAVAIRRRKQKKSVA